MSSSTFRSRPSWRAPSARPSCAQPRPVSGTSTQAQPLTARSYLGLLAARWADPVVVEPPDLLIAPRLGFTNALQFGRVVPVATIGERDARLALAGIGLSNASDHAA